MRYITVDTKNILYTEQAVRKIPSLINVKDSEGKSLYHNIIRECINSIGAENEEDILYYSNLIIFLKRQPDLKYSSEEK